MLLLGARWPIAFDCYLLRFTEGAEVNPHVDSVDTGRHFRLNIVLRQARVGGIFQCSSPLYESNRIKLFRPDIVEHSVSKVLDGTRYVLSIGWIRK